MRRDDPLLVGISATPRRRLLALLGVLLGGALIFLLSLAAAALAVRYAPERVIYHEVSPSWRLHVLLSSLIVVLLAVLSPRLTFGSALIVGGGAANAVASSFWAGVPDYLSFPYLGFSDTVFNMSDVAFSAGCVCVVVLVLWMLTQGILICLRELKQARAGIYERPKNYL